LKLPHQRWGSLSIDQAAAIAAESARTRRRAQLAAGALIRLARRRLPRAVYQAWLVATFAPPRRRRAFTSKRAPVAAGRANGRHRTAANREE
jgi:hypothetical protein